MTNIELQACHAIINLSYTLGEISKTTKRIANSLEGALAFLYQQSVEANTSSLSKQTKKKTCLTKKKTCLRSE